MASSEDVAAAIEVMAEGNADLLRNSSEFPLVRLWTERVSEYPGDVVRRVGAILSRAEGTIDLDRFVRACDYEARRAELPEQEDGGTPVYGADAAPRIRAYRLKHGDRLPSEQPHASQEEMHALEMYKTGSGSEDAILEACRRALG